MNIELLRPYDHLKMSDRVPIQAFVFDSLHRAQAFAAARRRGSPLGGLIMLLTLIVLIPLILIGLLLGAIVIAIILAVRTTWMRLRGLLPRNDGRDNVRIITRR